MLTLWTIQTLDAWNYLRENGVLVTNPDLVISDFEIEYELTWGYSGAYEWMVRQMGDRGVPNTGLMYPLWGWYQWGGAGRKARPDLRHYRHYEYPDGIAVRIEFNIDEKLVLLSDYDLWTWFVLNYWYLPEKKGDDDKFAQEIDKVGLNYFHTKPLPNEKWDASLRKSWEIIFNLDFARRDINAFARRNKSIQATFWELKKEWVVGATQFNTKVAA